MTDAERADHWKRIALQTRLVCGEALGLLGECSALCSFVASGGEVTRDTRTKAAGYSFRATDFVEQAHVDIPNELSAEIGEGSNDPAVAGVIRILVDEYGWDIPDARQAVEAARVNVDGARPADVPHTLAQFLNDAAGLPGCGEE